MSTIISTVKESEGDSGDDTYEESSPVESLEDILK